MNAEVVKEPTLKTVAMKADVSITTVVRAFSAQHTCLSATTLNRIFETARSIGYGCRQCRAVQVLPVVLLEFVNGQSAGCTRVRFCSRHCLSVFLSNDSALQNGHVTRNTGA